MTLFQEGATLEELHRRLTTTLAAFGRAYEVLYVDDGSTDGTFASLERIHDGDAHVRAVRLKRNVGQHPAMHAGLSRARGRIVVTMDGDLQNPPEDVPRLVEAVEAGYDVASGRRAARHDSWGRTLPSRLINGMLRRFTGVDISDFGCAFNAYRRDAVEPMLGAIGRQKFTKALVLSGGATVIEVDVGHAPRQGASSYTPLRLTRLALHVLAGFWPQPIQTAGIVLGSICSLASLALGVYGLVYWITNSDFPGPLLARCARRRRARRAGLHPRPRRRASRQNPARRGAPSPVPRRPRALTWRNPCLPHEPPPSGSARADLSWPPGRRSRPPAAALRARVDGESI